MSVGSLLKSEYNRCSGDCVSAKRVNITGDRNFH